MMAAALYVCSAVLLFFGLVSAEIAGEAIAERRATRHPVRWQAVKEVILTARLIGGFFILAGVACVIAAARP